MTSGSLVYHSLEGVAEQSSSYNSNQENKRERKTGLGIISKKTDSDKKEQVRIGTPKPVFLKRADFSIKDLSS